MLGFAFFYEKNFNLPFSLTAPSTLAAEHCQANLLLRVYDQQYLSAAVFKSKIRK
jgi:hypothetical protein